MPSTYSPDLRIELIANGEQSGTWGTTTNNNLGTLIEDAIAGAATVTVASTNQALTAANGAADEARCAVLVLDTLTGAPFNIFAPPVTKTYIIKNDSAYGATIYCSTVLGNTTPAGAGYDIPAGKAVFVRCDGTEFTDGINHIQNGFTLDIPLAVTSGGTGLGTVPALSVPVANSLNTLTALTVAANQSIKLNSTGTAWEAYTPTGGGGTVTQIIAGTGLSGGTITTSGTIALAANYGDTLNPYASKAANYVLASPDGTAGAPTFRALVGADLPTVGTITPSTYGSASQVAQITVDSKGRITGISNVAISGGGAVSSVTGSGAISASPTTGAVVVSVATAGASTAGIVSTGTQTFAGAKTFSDAASFSSTVTASGRITGNGFLSTTSGAGSYNFTATNESIYGSAGIVTISVGGSARVNFTTADLLPNTDNSLGLGSGARRWTAVYAVNGTIQTSDANSKQDIADLDDAERRVAVRIKGLIKKFRFKDAVAAKGNAARIHVGVIAQEVRDAFTAEGLDADRYGMFCSDTWWEREEDVYLPFNGETVRENVAYKTPVEGATEVTRLGVRYDELLAFVIAAV